MTRNVWSKFLKSKRNGASSPAGNYRKALRVEPLEGRRLLAVFTVTNLDDGFVDSAGDALGTLRQAIFDANDAAGDDTVEFAPGLSGTITLQHGELLISTSLTITGPAADLLTVDANGDSRVLLVDDGSGASIDVTITDVTLTGGVTGGSGGGILNSENLTVERSAIVGNQANDGGGIFNSGSGTLSLVDSTISGNTATHSGGGVRNNGGTGAVSSSTLSGNTAQYGGGIYVDTPLATVTTISNSTLSGNTATDGGGGVYNFTGHAVIEFSTITANKADLDRGGGVVSWGDLDLTLTEVYSSIISGNLESNGGPGADVDLVGGPLGGPYDTIQSNGYNLVGAGSAVDLFVETGDLPPGADPMLGPLAFNGGPTLTHALLFGSPAIDAGDPSFVPPPDFDQRGAPFARVFGAAIDIGAFENDSVYFIVDTLDDEDDGDFSTGDFSLREAIGEAATLAAGSPVILFHESLTSGGPAVIDLFLGELAITDRMGIFGPGAALLSIDAQDNSRIFTVDDFDDENLIDVTISSLTLTDGRDLGGGGAIFSKERLLVADSVITGNEAQWGGGIYNHAYGDLTVLRTTISGNTAISPDPPATGSGGGIYNWGGIAAIFESTITANMAPDAAGIRNINNGNLFIGDSTVSGNIAENGGGGLHNYGSSAFILRSTFGGNSAQFGAGFHNAGNGSLFIEKSTIDANMAGDYGAGINGVDDSTLHLQDSTVSGNIAVSSGGGIRNAGTTATILNSTLKGNEATYGGGLYVATPISEATIVRNSTISDNTATDGGAGIFNFLGHTIIQYSTITENNSNDFAGSGVVSWGDAMLTLTEVHSSIIAGNQHTDAAVVSLPNTFQSNGYNLIGVFDFSETFTQPGDQIIGADDPLLGPLADNGGLTLTHALLTGSPAIDGGDPSAVAGVDDVPEFDQRGTGFDRVVGDAVDVGAFEVQTAPPALVGDYNADGTVNAADYTIWRDTLGGTTDLRANGDDSNSVIDTADYGVWTSNFGDTPRAGVGQAVPDVSDLRQAQPDLPALATNHAEVDRGTDTPVRPSIHRPRHGGQECPPHASARMLALLELFDSLPRQEDAAELAGWGASDELNASEHDRALAEFGADFSLTGLAASL